MAGNAIGGKKAAATSKERHGADYFARIGAKGGSRTGKKGFALDIERARAAGRKGGLISKRGKKWKPQDLSDEIDKLEALDKRPNIIDRLFHRSAA